MKRIRVLESTVSSKIAAGEVIERPVSVVKELVENSIDAGSQNISIFIEGGGKDLIKISDDGEGIPRDEVTNAFDRHATSKITRVDDIFNINTMGFRGEALASIAAVSRVTLITKTKDESIGTQLKFEGGIKSNIKDSPAKKGCTIEVKTLFFNTPARLKFLSSDTQEASRITHLITRMAMGHPHISFKLFNNGKEVFFTSGNGDLREVIAKTYGIKVAKQMIQVEGQFRQGKIHGFISPLQHSRGNRTFQTFFVNHRFVKDSGLTKVIDRAYRSILPGGRFPICALFIDIHPAEIDVNVHPAKTQVKFREEKEVKKTLYNVIREGLKANCLIPREEIGETFSFKEPAPKGETIEKKDVFQREYLSREDDNLVVSQSERESTPVSLDKVREVMETYEPEPLQPKDKQNREITKIEQDTSGKIKSQEFPLKNANIVGQLFNTYIVVQGEEEFYIIDQHAAHEKILYEQFSGRFELIPGTQRLISPHPLEVSLDEIHYIEEHQELLLKMGFDLSVFGHNTVLVRCVPYYFNKIVDPEALREILKDLESPEYATFDAKGKLIASMACHSAVKAGDALSKKEIGQLIDQLKSLDNPYTCPHGRPTIISTRLYDLEKKFKRVL